MAVKKTEATVEEQQVQTKINILSPVVKDLNAVLDYLGKVENVDKIEFEFVDLMDVTVRAIEVAERFLAIKISKEKFTSSINSDVDFTSIQGIIDVISKTSRTIAGSEQFTDTRLSIRETKTLVSSVEKLRDQAFKLYIVSETYRIQNS